MEAQIDYNLLATMVSDKRKLKGKSLLDLAADTGVSGSTLSRIERNIGIPDADTLGSLCAWLGINADRLTKGLSARQTVFATSPDEPTLQVIDRLLRRDKNLSTGARDAIYKIMEIGYNLVTW